MTDDDPIRRHDDMGQGEGAIRNMTYERSTIDAIREICDQLDAIGGRADITDGGSDNSKEKAPEACNGESGAKDDLVRQLESALREEDGASDYENAIQVVTYEYDLLKDEILESKRDEEMFGQNIAMTGIYDFRASSIDRHRSAYHAQLSLLVSIFSRYSDGDLDMFLAREDVQTVYRGWKTLRKHRSRRR